MQSLVQLVGLRIQLFIIYCMTDIRNNYVCVRKFCEKFFNFTEIFVDFSSSNFTVSKSAGSLVVTLASSGKIPTQSFIIGIIAEADNSSVFPATGKKFIYEHKVNIVSSQVKCS